MPGIAQPTFTCSNSTIKTPKQCVKSFQSKRQGHQNKVNDVALMYLLSDFQRFHVLPVSTTDFEQVNMGCIRSK